MESQRIQSLAGRPNIGPQVAGLLALASRSSPAALRRVGAVEAVLRIRSIRPMILLVAACSPDLTGNPRRAAARDPEGRTRSTGRARHDHGDKSTRRTPERGTVHGVAPFSCRGPWRVASSKGLPREASTAFSARCMTEAGRDPMASAEERCASIPCTPHPLPLTQTLYTSVGGPCRATRPPRIR